MSEKDVLRAELRWGGIAVAAIVVVLAIMIVSAIAFAIHPPSNVETVDAAMLHLRGEFIESNLGTAVADDGAVTVRIVATQFAFVSPRVPVPAGKPVMVRMATPDGVQSGHDLPGRKQSGWIQ